MEPSFVQANGLRFAYLEQGNGPLVLFMHGFPDTAYTWDASLAAVAGAGFRGVAPFQRGYFPSEIPKSDATTDELGADVVALIETPSGALPEPVPPAPRAPGDRGTHRRSPVPRHRGET